MPAVIRIEDSKGSPLYNTTTANCWAGMANHFDKARAKLTKLHGPGTKHQMFLGFDVQRQMGDAREKKHYWTAANQMFSRMLRPMLGPDGEFCTTRHDSKGNLKYIRFKPSCPFWLVVITSSIFRCGAEKRFILESWHNIEKLQTRMGYQMKGWTQYAMAACISQYRSEKEWDRFSDSLEEAILTCSNNSGHLVIDGYRFVTLDNIRYINGWEVGHFNGTKKRVKLGFPELIKPLPGWTEEGYRRKRNLNTNYDLRLSTSGRDSFFVSGSSEGTPSAHMGNWIIKEAHIHDCMVKSKLTKEEKEYNHQRIALGMDPIPKEKGVHLRSFIEKVIIPNNL